MDGYEKEKENETGQHLGWGTAKAESTKYLSDVRIFNIKVTIIDAQVA